MSFLPDINKRNLTQMILVSEVCPDIEEMLFIYQDLFLSLFGFGMLVRCVTRTPLVRNMILVNRLALTCFYVGFQFETKTDQSSYVPKFFYELILNNRFFVDSPLLA